MYPKTIAAKAYPRYKHFYVTCPNCQTDIGPCDDNEDIVACWKCKHMVPISIPKITLTWSNINGKEEKEEEAC